MGVVSPPPPPCDIAAWSSPFSNELFPFPVSCVRVGCWTEVEAISGDSGSRTSFHFQLLLSFLFP